MTNSSPPATVLYGDPDHSGLRFSVVLILVAALLLSFLLLRLLITRLAAGMMLAEFATALACTGAIPTALAIGYLAEQSLKRRWHSGKKLLLEENALRYVRNEPPGSLPQTGPLELHVDWAKNLTLRRWYFALKGYPRAGRERLVSDSWLCLACRVQQDDAHITVYSYFPRGGAAYWLENEQLAEPFHPISLSTLYREAGKRRWGAASRPTLPASILTSADGPYWLAERERWQQGIELTGDDFATLMEYIEARM